MVSDAEAYCLHPAHIYSQAFPPCEARGADRVNALSRALREIASLAGSTAHDFGGSHDEQRAAIFNACGDALAGKTVSASNYRK
jgi:hypothetical protein